MSIQVTTIYFKGYHFDMDDIEKRYKAIGVDDIYDFIEGEEEDSSEKQYLIDGMSGDYVYLGNIIEETDPYDFNSYLGQGCLKIEEVEFNENFFIKKYRLDQIYSLDELKEKLGSYIITHIT